MRPSSWSLPSQAQLAAIRDVQAQWQRDGAALAKTLAAVQDIQRLSPVWEAWRPLFERGIDFTGLFDHQFTEHGAKIARLMGDLHAKGAFPSLETLGAQLRHLFAAGDLFRASWPANWEGVFVGAMLDLTIDYGLPIVEHPSAAVVQAFVEAMDTGDPYVVLTTHRTEILDDVETLLPIAAASTSPAVAAHGAELADIVFALRHDRHRGALRAAGSLLDVVLREMVCPPGTTLSTRKLRETHRDDDAIMDATFGEARQRMVLHCAAQTLAEFKPGDPVPERLNRHAIVHTNSPVQYTDRNAVWAALLLANLIALEAHRAVDNHDDLRSLSA